jgi:hypothetical protein
MSRPYYEPKQSPPYIGTGSVDTYTFDFKIESLDQLLVVEVDENDIEQNRVRGDDDTFLSTVTFNSDGGGTVVLEDPLAAGHRLVLLLANDEPAQTFEFSNKRSFNLKTFERALDAIVGPIQRLTLIGKQALKLHEVDDENAIDMRLPPGFADYGDCILVINDDGDGWKYGPSLTAVQGWKADAEQAAVDAIAAADAALISETNAQQAADDSLENAQNAALSEINAVAAAGAALVSETNAAASEAAAMAAQTAAENAANSTIWSNIVFLTSAASPRTITDSDKGTLFVVDTTASNFVFNLSLISSLNLTAPWSVGIKKSDVSGNIITINRSGGDTFDDTSTSKTISVPAAGITLVPDDTTSPDIWTSVLFGAGGGSAAPDLSGTLVAATPIAPLSGIAFAGSSYNNIKFLESNGGAIVIGSSPQIAPGLLIGQELLLNFVSSVNTIELNDGNGLDLAAKFISENKRKLCLEWNGSVWSEKYRR